MGRNIKTLSRRTLLISTLLASVSAVHAQPRRRLLLLSQQGGLNAAVDDKLGEHLRSRGWQVTRAHQNAEPAESAAFDLIVISSTVSSKDVHPGWRHVPVPLLTWENDLLDDLAMTGKRRDTDFGEVAKERHLWIVNAPHPMAGGAPAGVANVYVRQAAMSW